MIDLLIELDQYCAIDELEKQVRRTKIGSGGPPADSWTCRKCRAVNAGYVGTCGCGQLKKENDPQKGTSSGEVKESVSKEVDNLQQLKLCKELLDMGAITQEEFDAKKKQLLGL